MTVHVPVRMCAVCHGLSPRIHLIRLRKLGGRLGWTGEGPSTGRGLYFCCTGDCLVRLFREKRYRRQYLETMEEECIVKLRALLAEATSSSGGLEAQDVR
jgi:predicted RNA-binding protein YlxR (DUF448 family)